MSAPSSEEFHAWRDNPISQWVFKAILRGSDLQKEEWLRLSWEQGEASPLALAELRARADAYLALIETDYVRWCELNGDEPSKD